MRPNWGATVHLFVTPNHGGCYINYGLGRHGHQCIHVQKPIATFSGSDHLRPKVTGTATTWMPPSMDPQRDQGLTTTTKHDVEIHFLNHMEEMATEEVEGRKCATGRSCHHRCSHKHQR
jgi:hypothetical protein